MQLSKANHKLRLLGYLALIALALTLAIVLPGASWGQQAIINLPSADLTPKGQFFVMNESFVRMWAPKRNWKATNFLTYGLNDTTELAITNFGVGAPDLNDVTLALGWKSVLPLMKERFPEREIKLTGGYMLPVSVIGNGVGSYGYSHLSMRTPKTKTRLTAGINVGSQQVFGRDVVCFIGAIEQPITSELQFILEYYSGTHDFAGLVPGLVYHNHRYDVVLVAGYRLANNERSGLNGFVFEVGKFFGPFGSPDNIHEEETDHTPGEPVDVSPQEHTTIEQQTAELLAEQTTEPEPPPAIDLSEVLAEQPISDTHPIETVHFQPNEPAPAIDLSEPGHILPEDIPLISHPNPTRRGADPERL